MHFFSTAVAFLAALTAAAANPIERSAQDVWSPKLLFPVEGVTLTVDIVYRIAWDTSDAPANLTNKIGAITLNTNGRGTPVVLAGNFDILDGGVDIKLPWVLRGSNYSITLFGDSGNVSPTFSIAAPDPFSATGWS